MKSLNQIQLIGYVGQDPELYQFENGNHVAKFSLATSKTYKKQNGDEVKSTDWHNIAVYNKGAEVIVKYVNKGDRLYISGELKNRNWEDDKGTKHYSYEVQCKDFLFLNSKPKNQGSAVDAYNSRQSPEEGFVTQDGQDDLPF